NGDGERRRDGRQEGEQVHEASARHSAGHVGIGKQETEGSATARTQESHTQGVKKDLAIIMRRRRIDIAAEMSQTELAFRREKSLDNHTSERPQDEHE